MSRTTVFIAGFAGAELLDIAGPTSVFSTASSLLGPGKGYEVRLVAERAGPVVTSSGVTPSLAALSAIALVLAVAEPFLRPAPFLAPP